MSITFIETHDAWQELCTVMNKERSIAVDLESNGLHAYKERICLMQFATPNASFLIEPEAMDSGEELRKLLANPAVEKIFHSCDYDMRSLDRDYNAHVHGMFDTAIAAQFLGARKLGLDNVIREFLGIDIPKQKKIQKMDWATRPLSEKAMQYAANDVNHLHDLRDVLVEKLKEKGRLIWVREECRLMEAIRNTPPRSPEDASLRIKGTGNLSPCQRALFQALYVARDKIAASLDRPPFKVIGNGSLVKIAQNPHKSLNKILSKRSWLRHNAADELREAVEKGKNAEPVPRPKYPRPPNYSHKAALRLKALKEWRIEKGNEMEIDPSLVWPMRSLDRMARMPDSRDEELYSSNAEDVRRWQQENFADLIADLDVWKNHKGE